MPHYDFERFTRLQRTTNEIITFSHQAGRVVMRAWPTHHGKKIKPSGLLTYLRIRKAVWYCYCGLGMSRNALHPCQIVTSELTGEVHAYCHYDSNHCGFHINLSKIYEQSRLSSNYPSFPPLKHGDPIPNLDHLMPPFILSPHLDELAPLFEGSLGDRARPGHKQLRGTLLLRRTSRSKPHHRTPYVHEAPASNSRYREIDDFDFDTPVREVHTAPARLNAEAGPSRLPIQSASASTSRRALSPFRFQYPEASGKEAKQLRTLIGGNGISADVLGGLFEKCSKCEQSFVASALKAHIKKCLGVVVIE